MRCITPFTVQNPSYGKDPGAQKMIAVRCGQCPNCKRYRAAQWSFRLMQEDKVALSSYFITLTYNSEHVPITSNGFMSLSSRDLQLFWKRLRKLAVGDKLRYYACGEYGSRYMRPHYHAILFNLSDSKLVADAWSKDGAPLGIVHIGSVSSRSIMYTVNYMNKARFVPQHGRDDREREFSRMSRGLGLSYLSPEIVRWYKRNLHRQYVLMPDKWKAPLPRYYKDKMYTEEERRIIAFLNSSFDADELTPEMEQRYAAELERFNRKSTYYDSRSEF